MYASPRSLLIVAAATCVAAMPMAGFGQPQPESSSAATQQRGDGDTDEARFGRAMDAEVQFRYRHALLKRLRHVAMKHRRMERVEEIDRLLAEMQAVHAERMQEHFQQMSEVWRERLQARLDNRQAHRAALHDGHARSGGWGCRRDRRETL